MCRISIPCAIYTPRFRDYFCKEERELVLDFWSCVTMLLSMMSASRCDEGEL